VAVLMSNLIFNDSDFPNREEELASNDKYYARTAIVYLLADFLTLSKKLNIDAEIDSIVKNYTNKSKIEELLETAEEKNEKELFDDILEILIQFNAHGSLINLEVIEHLVSMVELIINKSLSEAKVDVIDINVLKELKKVIDNLNAQLNKSKKTNVLEFKKIKAEKNIKSKDSVEYKRSKEITKTINKLRKMKARFIDLMLDQYEKEQNYYVQEINKMNMVLRQHMDASIDIRTKIMEQENEIEDLNITVSNQRDLIKRRSEDMLVLRERQSILQENIASLVAQIKELEQRRAD
jgi:hypothetical protein